MSHQYYEQDYDDKHESRLRYFDSHFIKLSKIIAKQNGIALSSYLSGIKDFSSFKSVLQEVFSLDGSLAFYVSGMSDRGYQLFYERPVIQEIISANQEQDKDFYQEFKKQIPLEVKQVNQQTQEFFTATFFNKKAGKQKRVVAKKEIVNVRGKEQFRYRDSKGRFVKKV